MKKRILDTSALPPEQELYKQIKNKDDIIKILYDTLSETIQEKENNELEYLMKISDLQESIVEYNLLIRTLRRSFVKDIKLIQGVLKKMPDIEEIDKFELILRGVTHCE